jgi:hypothetical protein
VPAHCLNTKRTSHSYYVVMIDFGKKGLEAIVHPEDTRRDIVAQLASGESKHVVFIHHVDGLYIEDVTNELFDEAEALARDEKVSPWVREVQAMDRAEAAE